MNFLFEVVFMPHPQNNSISGPAMKQGRGKRHLLAGFAAVLYTVHVLSVPISALESPGTPCTLGHDHDPVCCAGMLLHTHGEFCRNSAGELICPLPELEEHEHADECYEKSVNATLPPEQDHTHTDACYVDERGDLICAVQQHSHSDACYETVPQETLPPHDHTPDCYTKQKSELTCTVPESAGHTHADSCYVQNEVPTCGVEESEAHTHDASCYGRTLVCETPENGGHTHLDACFTWIDVLTCQPEQTEPEKILVCTIPLHTHGNDCYTWNRVLTCTAAAEPVLVCVKPVFRNHVHSETCYEAETNALICGIQPLETHRHTQDCLSFEGMLLLCTLEEGEEHIHSHLCYESWLLRCCASAEPEEKPSDKPTEAPETEPPTEPEADPPAEPETEPTAPLPTEPEPDRNADDERPADWEKTFRDVDLTGAWAYDMIAIAETQIGYQESVRNYIVADSGDRKGYTRYGDWYGLPYGDWCAMFVSFCLSYAGVEDFPLQCNCNRWIEALTDADLYVSSDAYMPRPGDLVFIDYGRKATTPEGTPIDADHVAIVAEVIPATEDEPAKLVTIEGNHDDAVCTETRQLNDPKIVGYGILPDGPAAVYSCGMGAHTHEEACYDPEGKLTCSRQEHIHDEICRSRNLRSANARLTADITLSNAMYLPKDLSVKALLITSEDAGYSAMAEAAGAEDARFYYIAFESGGEPCQLPVGVQAHVQISFAGSVAEGEQPVILLEHRKTTGKKKNKITVSYEAAQPDADSFRSENLYFTAGKLSAFAVMQQN